MTSGTVLINRYELLGIIRNPVGCDVTAAFEGKVVPTRFCDEFQMVRAPRGASRPQPPFAPCSSAPRPASVSLPLSLSLLALLPGAGAGRSAGATGGCARLDGGQAGARHQALRAVRRGQGRRVGVRAQRLRAAGRLGAAASITGFAAPHEGGWIGAEDNKGRRALLGGRSAPVVCVKL